MGDFSEFKRRQIVDAHLSGASVTKMATLLGVSKAAVSKVMTAYINHGKTSSSKRNSGQKPKLRERDHHTLKKTVSKNHTHTYIHTYMPFHFINPDKPLGFGYETCPQDLTDTIRCAQINTYTQTK